MVLAQRLTSEWRRFALCVVVAALLWPLGGVSGWSHMTNQDRERSGTISEKSPLVPHASVPSTAIVELRQYTVHPGQRDVLIELFDREFIETQEAVGMTVIGQFRDLDSPDRFVWLRGYPDMATRVAGLTAFYGGPSWLARRADANATMIDADNVLLLEPASSATAISLDGPRSVTPSPVGNGHLIVATIYYPRLEDLHQFAGFFTKAVRPVLVESGAAILGEYVTSPHRNNFPRLPVREGERTFLLLCRFTDSDAYETYRASLARNARWTGTVAAALEARLSRQPETLRLAPTTRSRLQ
jgi:hypothetical protein